MTVNYNSMKTSVDDDVDEIDQRSFTIEYFIENLNRSNWIVDKMSIPYLIFSFLLVINDSASP